MLLSRPRNLKHAETWISILFNLSVQGCKADEKHWFSLHVPCTIIQVKKYRQLIHVMSVQGYSYTYSFFSCMEELTQEHETFDFEQKIFYIYKRNASLYDVLLTTLSRFLFRWLKARSAIFTLWPAPSAGTFSRAKSRLVWILRLIGWNRTSSHWLATQASQATRVVLFWPITEYS